jgi:hypothetical protein
MSVTDAESRASTTFNSGNAVVELIKNRTNKRLFRQLAAPAVEEAKQAFAQAGAVVRHKVEVGEIALSDPREGFWLTLEEYQKHTPLEVKEARRLALEARKTAEVCGLCGRNIQDEAGYATKVCTGIAVLFGTGPKYEDTVVCEGCAPEYMVREAKGEPAELPNGGLSYLSRFIERTCATCTRPVVVKKSGHDARRVAVPVPDKPGWYQATAFCCERCRWAFYNTKRSERSARAREKVCEVCGEQFTATRRDAKTCSPACKQKAYRQRQKQGAA